MAQREIAAQREAARVEVEREVAIAREAAKKEAERQVAIGWVNIKIEAENIKRRSQMKEFNCKASNSARS